MQARNDSLEHRLSAPANSVLRNPNASCLFGEDLALIEYEGELFSFIGAEESGLVRRVWHTAQEPVTFNELRIYASQIVPAKGSRVLNMLIDRRLLLVGTKQVLLRIVTPTRRRNRICKRLLVCMSGSIQSADFFAQLRLLRDEFADEMSIVLTRSARGFVQAQALCNLLGCRVYIDEDQFSDLRPQVLHIELSRWASMVLVAPATAATVSRIAQASSSDLLSQIIAALHKDIPLVIGPSMNNKMWINDGVQRNIQLCRERGYWIIEPSFGQAASDLERRDRHMVGAFGCQPRQLLDLLAAVARRKPSDGHQDEATRRRSSPVARP